MYINIFSIVITTQSRHRTLPIILTSSFMTLCSQFPPLPSLLLRNHWPAFYHYCLVFSGISQYNKWSFPSGFFLSTKRFWCSSILLHVMLVCFFLLLSIILYGLNQTLLIQSPVDKIWVLSSVWLSWIRFLWTTEEVIVCVTHNFIYLG